MIRRLGFVAGLAAAAALCGCVSLFPKSEPVTLYKLAATPRPTAPAPTLAGHPMSILLGPLSFTRAAGGDRILTTNGVETAYVAGARWVAPAPIMFQENLATMFDQRPGMNLATRGEAVSSDYVLRVDVQTFEVEYPGQALSGKGKKPPELSAPNVVVEARVSLLDLKNKALVSEKTFRDTKTAADNRVTAIVGAFDDATGLVINQIADWVACTQLHCVEVTTRS